jgi:hypothetical protein
MFLMDDRFANGPTPYLLATPLADDQEIKILQLSDHLCLIHEKIHTI